MQLRHDHNRFPRPLPQLSQVFVHVTGWYAVFVPAKTPAAIVQKMHTDTVATLSDPAIKGRLEQLGLFVAGTTPEELGQFLRSEMDKWGPVVKQAGLSIRE